MSRKSEAELKNIGPKTVDLVNHQFGKLTVIEYIGKNKYRLSIWKCQCSCINRTILEVTVNHLNSGKRTHCGCVDNIRGFKHGKTKSSEYKAWISMRERCYRTKAKNYHNYGGRGIRVCERWLESFTNFYTDMGNKPTSKHSLDRIDVNGDYCKENCKWATSAEQSINRRDTTYLTYNGETLPVIVWAKKLDIPYSRIKTRLKLGYSDEEALTNPLNQRKSTRE